MFRYAGEEGDDPPPPPPLRDFALADFVAAPKPTSLSSLSPLTPLDSPIYNYIIVFLLSVRKVQKISKTPARVDYRAKMSIADLFLMKF